MNDKFELIAKTFQGLEGVLADELKEIGAENVEVGRRMVSFDGDKYMMYKANFCCRTALRILKPFYKFKASSTDQLYEEVKKYDWDKVLSPNQTFAIDSTVYSEEFRHSKFVTYRVKDAIADYFNEKYGKRPSIRLTGADIIMNVHIAGDAVTLSLDSSGESLHKRGYRVASTEAPINEVLAAGLLKLAGWNGDCNLVDPMCGSGSFLIEAALIAANIYPGVFRNSFAFERWRDFDSEMFDAIYNDDSNEREFAFHIYGSDISPKAVDIAKANIKNASVAKYVSVEVKPFQKIEKAPEAGMLITNPPYGERIVLDDMVDFYHLIGDSLKSTFKGYKAWIIGPSNELFDNVGLKPSLRYPILNGSLECELREYVIFDGNYRDFIKAGNTVKNEEFKRAPKPKRRPKFDGDDNRESRRKPYGRRPEPEGKPRFPLEEKYRKPYTPKRKDATTPNDGERTPKPDYRRNAPKPPMQIRFREPQLSEADERPITHRRPTWKKSVFVKQKDYNPDNENNTNTENE